MCFLIRATTRAATPAAWNGTCVELRAQRALHTTYKNSNRSKGPQFGQLLCWCPNTVVISQQDLRVFGRPRATNDQPKVEEPVYRWPDGVTLHEEVCEGFGLL